MPLLSRTCGGTSPRLFARQFVRFCTTCRTCCHLTSGIGRARRECLWATLRSGATQRCASCAWSNHTLVRACSHSLCVTKDWLLLVYQAGNSCLEATRSLCFSTLLKAYLATTVTVVTLPIRSLVLPLWLRVCSN